MVGAITPNGDDIYLAVGRALSEWGRLESELGLVFCNAINPHQANPADAAFWAMMSFDAKVTATSNVLDNRFPKMDTGATDDIRSAWEAIRNRIVRRNKLRNKIAHGTVVTLAWSNAKGRHESTFFAPFYYAGQTVPYSHAERISENFDPRPANRLSVEDLRAASRNFATDGRALRDLSFQVRDLVLAQEGHEQ